MVLAISPERRISQIPSGSHAPLALPEEISGSTCTSLMSMSPDRHLHHNEVTYYETRGAQIF